MLWLSLLVLMLLIAAAPGISIYVEHRSDMAKPLANASPSTSADPIPER